MNFILSFLIITSSQIDTTIRNEERRLLNLLRESPESYEIWDTLSGLYKTLGYKKLSLKYSVKVLEAENTSDEYRQKAILRMLEIGAYKTLSRVLTRGKPSYLLQRLPLFYFSSFYTGLRMWRSLDDERSSTGWITWLNANNFSPLWLSLCILRREEPATDTKLLIDYALILNWFSDLSFYPFWGVFRMHSLDSIKEGVTLGGVTSNVFGKTLMLSVSLLRSQYVVEFNVEPYIHPKFNIGFDLYYSTESRPLIGVNTGYKGVQGGKLLNILFGAKFGGPGEYINPRVLVYYPDYLELKSLTYLTFMLEFPGLFQVDFGLTYERISRGNSMTIWFGYSLIIRK